MPPTGDHSDRRSYAVLAGAVWALLCVTTLRGQWLSDWWIHLATVKEAAARPLNPLDPLTGTATAFPYFSPYTLGLGLVSRVTGLSAQTVLEGAGLLVVAGWLAALPYFVRAVSAARHAAAWVLGLTLFLWGPGVLWWSGFFSLGTLSMGPAWPSVLAGALWLTCAGAAWRWLDAPHPMLLCLLVGLPGLIILVHPWTGILAGLSLALLFLGRASHPRQFWPLGAAALVAVAVVSAWPYWSFWALLGRSGGFSEIHEPLYQEPLARFGLVLLCVPALIARARRSWRDPLVLWFGAGLTVVAFGWVSDQPSYGRAWPLVMLAGHTALGIAMAQASLGRWARPVVLAGLVVGLSGQLYAFLRVLPAEAIPSALAIRTGLRLPYPDISWTNDYTAAGDVVVAGSQFFHGRQLPALGRIPLSPPWPDPLLPDEGARTLAREQVLGSNGPARRRAIHTWHVRWVLVPAGKQWTGAGVDGHLVATSPDGSRLYRTLRH